MNQNEAQITPQQYAAHIASLLEQARQECRVDLKHVDDPRAQALFETTAEVIGGLCKALKDYQRGKEAAWHA